MNTPKMYHLWRIMLYIISEMLKYIITVINKIKIILNAHKYYIFVIK